MSKKTQLDRFMDKVMPVTESGCWIWLGPTSDRGYGKFRTQDGNLLAHRYAYKHLRGAIPDGLQLDHLCRVRCCVNPDHMEPVTNRENALRGVSFSAMNARKTHCLRGHLLDGDNVQIVTTRGRARECLQGKKMRRRSWYLAVEKGQRSLAALQKGRT